MADRLPVLHRLATRAMPRTTTTGARLPGMNQEPTGNVLRKTAAGSGTVKAGTQSITYTTPGQPMWMSWDGNMAVETYYRSLWVMRCVRTIAETLAMLPFRAGKSARNPKDAVLNCPLAWLLGPQPGSPNPRTSSRALWTWSAVQYLITGKMAWETQLDPNKNISALWPLVSPAVSPIASPPGAPRWWDGFQYQTPYGITNLTEDRVFYAWRPSQRDFRQPESPLESATTAIELQVGIERFMWGLLKRGLTAAHVVVTAPFEESDMRRAWQEQFLSEFTGFDNAGKIIFGEAEMGERDQRLPPVQIQPVGTRPVDAQLLQMWQQAKIDITVTLGVPESLIGNASQRTYSNADSEYRNFWTITMMNFIAEIEDGINTYLAPRLGNEVGWFDTSKVVALQPPQIFGPLDPVDAIDANIVTAQQVADILDLVELEAGTSDVETAPVGQEAIKSSAMGRSALGELELRARQINREYRAMTLTQSADIADKVHGYLARNYPRRTLTWVHDSRWDHRQVPLDDISMERRPGGRDQDKIESMAKAIRRGARLDPVVLVQPPDSDKLRIADGYHRAIAHRRAGRQTIPAYVATPATEHGPWEKEMHVAKQNRAMELVDMALRDPEHRALLGLDPENTRAGVCTGPGPCDTGQIGPGPNWVTKVNGLPRYIRAIAHALIRNGRSEQDAIRLAVGTVRRWANGGGDVTDATRARARAALAQWEAKKAEADARSNGHVETRQAFESGSAGLLKRVASGPVPPKPRKAKLITGPVKNDMNDVGPRRPEAEKLEAHSPKSRPADRPAYTKAKADKPHAFQGTNLSICRLCNQPVLQPIHQAAFSDRPSHRAADPPFVPAR